MTSHLKGRKSTLSRLLMVSAFTLCTVHPVLGNAFATTTDTSSKSNSADHVTKWDATIRSAMHYVAPRSKVPLAAPALKVLTDAYVSAQVTATKDAYSVTLQLTTQPLKVNDPAITRPPNGALADYIGSFGGHKYASRMQAQKALDTIPFHWHVTGAKRPVVLGDSTNGWVYGNGVVQWRIGQWTFDVADGPMKGNVALAKSMVTHLATRHLPGAQGFAFVENAGDGEHTQFQRRSGSTIYTCGDYHSANVAIDRTCSMRAFP